MKKPSPTIVPGRLTAAREARKLSQADLAREVGMSQQAIGAMESGVVKRSTRLFDIAAELNVDMDYLLGLQDDPFVPPADKPRPARALNQPTIGVPDLAIFGGMGGGGLLEVMTDGNGNLLDPDQMRGRWTFPDYVVEGFRNLRTIYAWEARGDSMEPTIAGGSVVFVDTSQRVLPPDDIYAIDYGDGLMVKRLKLIPRTDRIAIISDNPVYGTDEILRDEVNVYGRIVGWFQWRG